MQVPFHRLRLGSFRLIAIAFLWLPAGRHAASQVQAQLSPTSGQVTPSATPAAPDINSLMLQYQTALSSADEKHRHFIEYEWEQLKWIIAVAAPIIGVIFLLLNWKGRREIRTQVNARFKTVVDAEIEDRLSRFDSFLEQNRKKIEETDRFIELVYDLTYAFHVLSVKLDDPEWEAARRDAEKSLQAWRGEMPSSRRLGILLGRLYKRLNDYNA
ncbi:MAG: hypothetical protein QOD64_514, partial [Verrucomicrobiota bacterium]